ncbi:unnamed protein product [Cuscuta epithymum]|uniref:Aminotransferase-like plant mobile domain-containing protein n=1 Tax=Cuscuta epithymum TaxID=186058 RepID=A0AAV0CD23_9ASTE|nr:unnamed protein product [Cuscuta epithymum]
MKLLQIIMLCFKIAEGVHHQYMAGGTSPKRFRTSNLQDRWIEMCTESAGFTPQETGLRTSDIVMSSVMRRPILPHSTDEEVTQHARVIIWQLLGGFLFPDTSSSRIRLYFLELLQDDLALARDLNSVRLYWDLLDRMTESQFDFFPYPFDALPQICVDAIRLWAYEGMLVFCNMIERHYPDRFLRQFHIMQDIPKDTEQGNDHHASRSAVSSSVLTWWADRHNHVYALDYEQKMNLEATDRYRRWYSLHGMIRVRNPSHVAPAIGYTPTTRDWGLMKQGMHDVYQLANRAGYEDVKERLERLPLELGNEEMLHHGVFLYPDAQEEPAPVPRRRPHRRRNAPTCDRRHGHADEDRDEYAGDGGNEEEGNADEVEGWGEESQPPPQFSSHQDFPFF